MHLIFTWSIFLGVSSYDVTCNCDITGSPFLENMASLKKWLRLNTKSKCERKVNFLSLNFYYQQVKVPYFTGHFYVSNLK